jgi:hypothetical protein
VRDARFILWLSKTSKFFQSILLRSPIANPDLQSHQSTNRPEDNQKITLLCQCSLERARSTGLPSARIYPVASASGCYLNGCPGMCVGSDGMLWLLTLDVDAYSRWLLCHSCDQNRGSVAQHSRNPAGAHSRHDGQRNPRRQRKVRVMWNGCEFAPR